MAKHRPGANDKTFVVGLVSLVAERNLSTPQLSAGPLGCTGSALCASCVEMFCGYLFRFYISFYWQKFLRAKCRLKS